MFMKKILVLVLALMMSVNCKAQWQRFLLQLAKNIPTIVESGNSVKEMVKSSHITDLNTGKDLCETYEYERALDYLTKINEDDFDFVRVEAYYYRALCYIGLEEYKKSVKLLYKVIDYQTSWRTLNEDLIEELKNKSSSLLFPVLAMSLDSENSNNFAKGYQALIEKNNEGAFHFFSLVNERDKTLLRIMTHFYKGLCRVFENEKEKAILNFKRAIYFTVPDNALYPEEIKKIQQYANGLLSYCEEGMGHNGESSFMKAMIFSMFIPNFEPSPKQ